MEQIVPSDVTTNNNIPQKTLVVVPAVEQKESESHSSTHVQTSENEQQQVNGSTLVDTTNSGQVDTTELSTSSSPSSSSCPSASDLVTFKKSIVDVCKHVEECQQLFSQWLKELDESDKSEPLVKDILAFLQKLHDFTDLKNQLLTLTVNANTNALTEKIENETIAATNEFEAKVPDTVTKDVLFSEMVFSDGENDSDYNPANDPDAYENSDTDETVHTSGDEVDDNDLGDQKDADETTLKIPESNKNPSTFVLPDGHVLFSDAIFSDGGNDSDYNPHSDPDAAQKSESDDDTDSDKENVNEKETNQEIGNDDEIETDIPQPTIEKVLSYSLPKGVELLDRVNFSDGENDSDYNPDSDPTAPENSDTDESAFDVDEQISRSVKGLVDDMISAIILNESDKQIPSCNTDQQTVKRSSSQYVGSEDALAESKSDTEDNNDNEKQTLLSANQMESIFKSAFQNFQKKKSSSNENTLDNISQLQQKFMDIQFDPNDDDDDDSDYCPEKDETAVGGDSSSEYESDCEVESGCV